MMLILMEALILCGAFTLMVYLLSREPIKTLYNYPPAIQERVRSLPQYQGMIPTQKDKISAKVLAAFLILIVVSLILRYINGCESFAEAFWTGFFIWTIVNAYDALIIDCLWFCHDKQFVFAGTEDMEKEYRNYWFHIRESLKGELIGGTVCLLAAAVVQFVL